MTLKKSIYCRYGGGNALAEATNMMKEMSSSDYFELKKRFLPKPKMTNLMIFQRPRAVGFIGGKNHAAY